MNGLELLALYKQEKEDQEDIFNPFPSFRIWKTDIQAENDGLYTTVDISEAVRDSDSIVEQAEQELDQQYTPKKVVVETKQHESVSGTQTKGERAMSIYRSMMVGSSHPKRRDVISRFVTELCMTPNGASTYHNTMKNRISK